MALYSTRRKKHAMEACACLACNQFNSVGVHRSRALWDMYAPQGRIKGFYHLFWLGDHHKWSIPSPDWAGKLLMSLSPPLVWRVLGMERRGCKYRPMGYVISVLMTDAGLHCRQEFVQCTHYFLAICPCQAMQKGVHVFRCLARLTPEQDGDEGVPNQEFSKGKIAVAHPGAATEPVSFSGSSTIMPSLPLSLPRRPL